MKHHFINFFTIVYDYKGKEVGFFGGDRIAMAKEWYYCLNEMTPKKKPKKKKCKFMPELDYF